MLDFLSPLVVTLITGLLLAGFLAMAGLLVFEIGTVLLFWMKERNNKHPKLS